MSDQPKPEKIYLNGCFVREKEFSNGGSVMNVTVLLDDLEAFAKAHETTGNDGKRTLRLAIGKRKAPSESGITHWVALDTWKPKQQDAPADAPEKPDIAF